MNFYRSLGRWYVQFDWADPVNGYRLAIGRHAEPITDQFAADDAHPFQDAEALTGNIVSPVGAQSFGYVAEALRLNELEQAGKLTGAEVDAVLAKNWVNQGDEE